MSVVDHRISRGARCCVLLGAVVLLPGCRPDAAEKTPPVADSPREKSPRPHSPEAKPAAPPDRAISNPQSFADYQLQRTYLDRTVWADEVQAQEYETAFVQLWDDLRASRAPWGVLRSFFKGPLAMGQHRRSEPLDCGIELVRLDGEEKEYANEEFARRLTALENDGFQLVQSEWHHAAFHPPRSGSPARSTVAVTLHVARPEEERRWIVKADLEVEWPDGKLAAAPSPVSLRAANVRIMSRTGEAPFQPVLKDTPPAEQGGNSRANPIVVYDLDGDGLSEILVVGRNRVYWNRGEHRYEVAPLSPHLQKWIDNPRLGGMMDTALLADLTDDGHVDLLTATWDGTLRLLPGDGQGKFISPPRVPWNGNLQLATVITAGDVDADGDLDVWIGQYKPPYQQGQMPTPYYDANDGHPAYLLRNDGTGQLADVTDQSGLSAKRFRRTYGASLVDLNADGHLDLLVTSDFAGLDLYHGDGKGHFTDVTERVVDQRHNFGMSHRIDDFDGDGRLDFLVIGMSSTTARRLDRMRLEREDRADVHQMRAAMGYGNRMYLQRDGRFVQPSWNDDIARTGWSWGCSSLDFDNDGDRDVYVANGHQSGRSARDYCTTFWRHDIYTGTSQPDTAVRKLFADEFRDMNAGECSWNGYEKNALLMNRSGRGAVDVSFLLGTALEFDARTVVGDDLDGDGRVDLLVVENMQNPQRKLRQTLHVLANRLDTRNHWIGVRVGRSPQGRSPIGARITLVTGQGRRAAVVTTGDSHYAQHAPAVHFGLGSDKQQVEKIEVQYVGGERRVIERPEVDRYHTAE